MDWPMTLPQAPVQDGYQESPANNTIRTSMDVGPAKVRRRQTVGVRTLQCTYELSQAQVQILDDFFVSYTASGAVPFNLPHPRTGALVPARFAEPPAYSSREHEATASCKFEVLM